MSSGYAQWSPYTTYVVNDVVEFAGLVYQATQINTNVSPFPVTAVWTLIGGGGGGFVQTLSQAGNTVSLSPSGGAVNVASTTLVAATGVKTTHQSLVGGTDTVFVGAEVIVESSIGLTVEKPGGLSIGIVDGIISGNDPTLLTRAGTLKVLSITDNADVLGTAGQSLTSGAGGELVWATIGAGGTNVNAGTNISIPDPSIPVVSVAISSTLDMVQNTLDNCPIIQSSGNLDINTINGVNINSTDNVVITTGGGGIVDLQCGNGLNIYCPAGGANIQTDGAGAINATSGSGITLQCANGLHLVNSELILDVLTDSAEMSCGAGGLTLTTTGDITLSPTGVVKILNATPTLRFDDTTTSVDVVYNPTGSQFSESALTTSAHEIGVYTGVVGENIAMGVNQALQVGYLTGQGLPLFLGENGSSSYSGLYLGNGNNPTDFLIIDRKDNTDVTQTACSVALTGAGIVNIDSQLATGGIGITTTASADISINSGKDLIANATTELKLQIGGTTQARLAGGGNIGVGGSGSDGSVFLLKNDDSLYGALNYNGTNDTLNIDNGGSGISVGASGITMTPATGVVGIVSDTAQVLFSDATNVAKGSLNYASVNNKISLGALGSGTVLALTTASADLDLNAVGGHIQLIATGNPITISTNVDGLGASGNIELTANGTGAISLTTGSTVGITGGNLDLNTNDLVDGGNLGAESMVLQSNLAKAEFKDGLGVLKGSMGYNSGTDYMDLTGSAGFEINTTVGDLNMTANGGKINMTTNGNNIEIFGNTTGGFFADVNIGSSDGDLDMGVGGNIIMNAGTTGGNITITAFADFSVSSTTVKLPTLPSASTEYQLFYDTSTKDVSYGPAFPAITVVAVGAAIALTPAMNRSTYILTGVGLVPAQTFTNAALVGTAAGWCVYLRNGNNSAVDLSINAGGGAATLHGTSVLSNSAYMLLYWDGAQIVKYT